jgi:DNA-binding transcriptional MerR regulator
MAELARHLESEVPDALERIKRLLRDEPFQDMCVEYEECSRCLRQWSHSAAQHRARIEEYMELIINLQEEILRYLQEHP